MYITCVHVHVFTCANTGTSKNTPWIDLSLTTFFISTNNHFITGIQKDGATRFMER